MSNKLKAAFDEIHAEEPLKDKTKAFLALRAGAYRSHTASKYKRLIPVVTCLLFILCGWGGYQIYFTPTSVVSIDVNPSIELGVNRFDKVVSVNGYNSAGMESVASLRLKFLDYTKALNQILGSEYITNFLLQDEVLSIAVVGPDNEQTARMLVNIKAYTTGQTNIYCYSANFEEVASAHAVGLSYGKYRAFLEVQALNPDITPGEIQAMTMREIRDLIEGLSAGNADQVQGSGYTGRHNAGNGHRFMQGEKGKNKEP